MTTHASSTPQNPYRLPPRTSSLHNPTSPNLTPTRTTLLQNYTPTGTTPSGTYLHHTEDPLIFEIGCRLLRAGFANEPAPRCELEWSNGGFWSREGYGGGGGANNNDGERGELWMRDLQSVELGVVEDVVERGVRMAYNKYLLLDSKLKRVVLVVPTCFPTKVLTALVKSFFVHFQMPGIMLLEAPIMASIAAGTRSALVVDLQWEECAVNVVYELRAVGRGGARGRSRRSGKVLKEIWKEFLEAELQKTGTKAVLREREVEEILVRVGWCRKFGQSEEAAAMEGNPIIEIPITSTTTPTTLKLPFSKLSVPAERAFFAPTTFPSSSPDYPDDDDLPIPRLVYEALKDSPIDVRAACMQRIIIVGGGSLVPGVKRRIVDEVRGIVERVGWEKGQRRNRTTTKPEPPKVDEVQRNSEDEYEVDDDEEERYEWRDANTSPRSQSPRGEERKLPSPKVKGLESLGNWVGASLVAGMKGRGAVEVEREKFLQMVASGGTGFPFGY